MTRRESLKGWIRDIVRWWPLIIIPVVLAAAASTWSAGRQVPEYTATTRLVVIPLVQWDETFLGISLARDGGDPKRTAATVAALLDSRHSAELAAETLGSDWTPEAVDAAVDVSAVDGANTIAIKARSRDPDRAERLAEAYARAALADRWRTIAAQLDARIAAIADTTSPDPNAGEASARRQTLTLIRQGGADPTVKIDSTSPAVPDKHLPIAVVVGLASAGGLAIGLLTAIAMARMRRRAYSAQALRREPAVSSPTRQE
jgi:capsular polysaccharide biosynthesis protein